MRHRRSRTLDAPRGDTRTDDRLEEVEALATACGFALGAALMCHSIAEERILVAADRIVEILRRFDDGTRRDCVVAFKEALADGKASVDSGQIDESMAENTLRRIERMLGR
jgi:hypothetical protein